MPRARTKELITCRYFTWRLGCRDGVYYADGRSNPVNAGRHSLGTREYEAARRALDRLDAVRAVVLGRAGADVLAVDADQLSLDEGRKLYEDHIRRPRVVGGARPTSAKRYRAVFDKFVRFA